MQEFNMYLNKSLQNLNKLGTNKGTTTNSLVQYGKINAVFQIQNGAVAQLGERFNGIEEVRSSSLLSSTKTNNVFRYNHKCMKSLIVTLT